MTHLLVTNDFPPKVGGIQSYLWELWRRLPPEQYAVLTIGHPDAASFDERATCRIERVDARMLLPTPALRARVRTFAREVGASLVVLDPALPVGLIGPDLGLPYAVVLHGAEVTVPGRLPGARALLARVVTRSSLVVAAGNYPLAEASRAAGGRLPPSVVVPPGVDVERFRPLAADERAAARRRLGLPETGHLVVSVSRLVPRKGMDVLVEAAARLAPDRPDLCVAIGGSGRDRARLERLAARLDAPVRFLGRVAEEDLPVLDAAADVWAMLCRNRWLGLEQEGFGIVFLEAAAAGVAQVAGRSGGAEEAVEHEVTGLVLDRPADVVVAADALARLLDDDALRARLGAAARARAVSTFDYDLIARRLGRALADAGG
ncbi:MAG TPA: glycosyltransferase family 4 protein [Acidimicrobiales bacterium]|nr:glycosyltransferase family 4 protein [Acidimicrobiales bacterium]